MKRIILASSSPQRKALLKQVGIRFKVVKSKAQERRRIKSNPAELVKQNALRKARDVAKRQKHGVVLGCDTIVVCGKRIIGKPKNLADATKILRFLSRRPQWVYTGLAIVDIDTGKTITDFEKTKVFMNRLSDAEIKGYFKKVSPLDKAGAFDIQRFGGLFIKRIEGCFYNVVGLPLAKLYQMFKKVGVHIFAALLVFSLFGCHSEYNVATGRQDTLLYDTEKEIQIGQATSRAIEEEYDLSTDAELIEKINEIGRKIVVVCDRKDINYRFRILDDDTVNAVSIPGYVYLFQGLIDESENDDELAGVIAHEVGHIVAKHSIKKLQAALGYSLMNILLIPTSNAEVIQGANAAFVSVFLAYSREDEFLADSLAAKYTALAGYDPHGIVTFLEKLKDQKERRQFSYWRTHPYITERIARIRGQIHGGIDFVDYMNIGNE